MIGATHRVKAHVAEGAPLDSRCGHDHIPAVSSPPRLAEYVIAAGDYVRRALGVELDGSPESLAFVDHYLAHIGPVADDVLRLVATAIGVYFGELVVARLDGVWGAESDDPAEWVVALEAAPLAFRPVAMAAEAIRSGEVEGYDASLATPPAYREPLAEALEAAGPVEESYYYSLTGRFETLEHAAAILAELRRRERTAEPTRD
jgi:hypothetical protein